MGLTSRRYGASCSGVSQSTKRKSRDSTRRTVISWTFITSIPVVSSASTPKPLATLDRLYSQILSTASDKKCTLEILGALIAMVNTRQIGISWDLRVETLRIAEQLLDLQSGDGHLALRIVYSLVHVPDQPLVPDDDLSLPDDRGYFYRKEAMDTVPPRVFH